ncbi:hypothetical protein N7523_006834 [Penicillium sp. IBT 18751x]|nr:hypothetical protein N7523_006834 [Penicillium sp. IBT 18751x]
MPFEVAPETMHWRGSHTYHGTKPKMDDLQITVANEARQFLVDQLAERPGTAYVEYSGRRKRVTEHGLMYVYNGTEDIKYTDPDSFTDGNKNKWSGTITVDLAADFRQQPI